MTLKMSRLAIPPSPLWEDTLLITISAQNNMTIRNHYRYDNGDHTVLGTRVGRFNMGINTTFIIYRIGDTQIDTGPSNQWPQVKQIMQQQWQFPPLRQLLITHHHEDHSGNAARIAELTGITPFAPQQARDKLTHGYRTPPMQKLIWGSPRPVITQAFPEQITLSDGSPVIPVHTPGHAKDLTCFFLPEQKYLFSGDMYIARSLKHFRSDENLQQLIDSLNRLLALDFKIIFCPHRGIVEDGYQALTDKRDNLIKLCEQVQQQAKNGRTEKQIMHSLLGPEDTTSFISFGNFSKSNLIREARKVKID